MRKLQAEHNEELCFKIAALNDCDGWLSRLPFMHVFISLNINSSRLQKMV
jgi:hypothetical protein